RPIHVTEGGVAVYRSREVEVEMGVKGTVVARSLTLTTPWLQEFGPVQVLSTSRIPKLSVGPVSAEFTEGSVLLLSCPVYGGPLLKVSWFKDTNLIYSHTVPACSYDGGTSRLRVVTERGTSDYECTIMMWVFRPAQVDRGIYVCQVTDRGYLASQMVVAGSNQSLQLDMTPRVLTIHQ
ncbi:putative Immunoglobulin I-set domain-containing protein 1, partial [Homarus americanus]